MIDWLGINGNGLWWFTIVSVVMFVSTLVVIPMIVVRIPADYFFDETRKETLWAHRHPVIRLFGLIVKNLLGVVVVLAGIAMLFTPGQGVITILIGIMLIDFPGKRVLERKMVRQPAVLRSINWLRAKGDQPPLRISGSRKPPGVE